MLFNIPSSLIKAMLLTVGIGVTGLLLYKNIKIEELMQWKTKIEAEEITVNHFAGLLEDDNKITLDNAILHFENSKCKTLKEHAEKRGRKAESYQECYSYLFQRSKDRKRYLDIM